jgi:iron(III) transport system ATP-binding protein
VTPAIELSHVSFAYGDRPIVSEFDLSLAFGERVALLGPSGSGKSTLLRLMLGFEAPQHGAVLVRGALASRDGRILIPPEERQLSVVFQDLALWPHLSVHRNLAFALASKRLPRSERSAKVRELLGRIGLAGRERCHPEELSGGERQRVAIARALIVEPTAILLDEPLSNLDVSLRRELLALFRELFAERSCAVLHVTHDLREAAALAGRIVIMENGTKVQEGTLEELRTRPASRFVQALLEDLVG